jgi:hypothetical protein
MKLGATNLLQISGVLVAAGFGFALIGTTYAGAMIGLLVAGFATSNMIALIFGAAARRSPGGVGAAIAAASSIGYLGFLVGPPVVGVGLRRRGFARRLSAGCRSGSPDLYFRAQGTSQNSRIVAGRLSCWLPLEGVAQGKLNLTLVVSKGAGDGLTAGNVGVSSRDLKLRMVEHVEELGAKLDVLPLGDMKILDRAEVHVHLVRSTQRSIP